MITPLLRRLTARFAWRDVLRPRVAWAAMAVSALVAGGAIQHSIERLEAASEARARLERQNAGLHERFQATPGAATAALQQIRASHDEAVASAAAWSRWTVWGSLAWMLGVGVASAWSLQRRTRTSHASSTPAAPAEASARGTAEPVPAAMPAPSAATAGPDWQAVLREIRAVSDLIGPAEEASASRSAPLVRIEPTVVELTTDRSVVHQLPGTGSLRTELRLAA